MKKRYPILKIIVFALILSFYASFLIVKISLPNMDNDAGLYISDGKLIVQNHSVFKSNPYSFIETNFPIVNHHWLSSAIFYLVTAMTGFEGLTIFKTLVLLSAFSILFLASLKKADFWLVAFFSLPTILLLTDRTRIRPEMFSYLLIAIFLYLLFDLERHPERKKIFWLVPLQVIWVNLHIYFFLGLLLVAGFLFEKIVLHIPKKFWQVSLRGIVADPVIKKLLIITVLLVAACFINPNFVNGALAPIRTHSYATFMVSENQPLFNFRASILSWGLTNSIFGFGPMAIILIISFIFGFRKKKSAPPPIMFFFAGLGSALASLFVIRLSVLFGIMFLPIVSSNLNDIFLRSKDWLSRKRPKLSSAVAAVLICSVAGMFVYQFFSIHGASAARGYPTDWGIGLDRYSAQAGKFFRDNNLKGPIFDDYDIGGYIIYNLFPKEKIFVDNNGADSYPVSFFDDLYVPMLTDEARWQESDAKYNLNAIFMASRDAAPYVSTFLWRRLHDPNWSLVYADTYAYILLKNNVENRDIISKFQITKENIREKLGYMLESKNAGDWIMASRIFYLIGDEDLAVSTLKKLVAKHPDNSWAWLYMGSIRVMQGNPLDLVSAVIFLENAVNTGQRTSEGYTWLGLAYFKFGQLEKAKNALQTALWFDPDRQDTNAYLAELKSYINSSGIY